jgi:hypothetical protein
MASLFIKKVTEQQGNQNIKPFPQKPCIQVPVTNPSFNGSKGEGQPTAVAMG